MRTTLPSGAPAEFVQTPGAATGLLVFVDINGLRPLFDEHCARWASDWGVSVCAPEPFPGREAMTLEERFAAMKTLTDQKVMSDAAAAFELLGAGRVVAIGFCMGGMYAMKAAALLPVERAASFYGMIRIPGDWRGEDQGEPLDLLRDHGAASKVLAINGTADPWVPVEDGEALRALGAQVVTYEEAEHGFVHDPDRPAHRPQDAADAWRRAREWLVG